MMTRTITAEYLADENKLKLDEPLEGVEDHARLNITLADQVFSSPEGTTSRPWMKLRGSLSVEDCDALSQAIEEAFGPINENRC